MSVGRILPGKAILHFSRSNQKDFSRAGKVMKFDFTHLKLREQPFSAKFSFENVKFQNPTGQ